MTALLVRALRISASLERMATVDSTLASRYHERFADHAVSIAKKVQYLATGDWIPANLSA